VHGVETETKTQMMIWFHLYVASFQQYLHIAYVYCTSCDMILHIACVFYKEFLDRRLSITRMSLKQLLRRSSWLGPLYTTGYDLALIFDIINSTVATSGEKTAYKW